MMFQRQTNVADKVRVGEVLIQKKLITPDDLKLALAIQRETHLKLGEILIQQGLVTRRQMNEALSEQRWRNWTAAGLLALGSFVTVVPKFATPNTVGAISPSEQRIGTQYKATGGANTVTWNNNASSPSLQARNLPADKGFYMPLSANPYPTIASPLTGFCHPLNGLGYLSQGIRGSTHRGRMEYAYDLATNIGTPVYAMRAGRVMSVQDRYPDTGGGPDKISQFNYVLIEHDGGYRSAYLHLQQGFREKVSIKAGDRVEADQLIGYSGNSGWSSGPHLHIELQKPGSPFTFTATVPFAIAGVCEPGQIAQKDF
ncbi:MAG: peptidoglycan DD-metalloendopeptidase family protein [Thermosynechococcaceae cyanobacterium]